MGDGWFVSSSGESAGIAKGGGARQVGFAFEALRLVKVEAQIDE